MKVLHFNINDELSEIDISCKTYNSLKKKLTENSDIKGNNSIDCVYSWHLEDKEIKCFGYTEGDHSQINSHMIPIYDEHQFNLYGSLFLIGFVKNKPVDLHISEYALLSYINEDLDDFNNNSDDINGDTNDINDSYINNTFDETNLISNDNKFSNTNFCELDFDTKNY